MANMANTKKIADTLTELATPIDALTPYPNNPRNGDIDALKESLTVNGQYRPIVANKPTMQILAGNHTYMAAMELGWKEIAVTWVDVTADDAKRIVLADNRLSDMAQYDTGQLTDLLGSLPDLDGTGYNSQQLDVLLKDLAADTEIDLEFNGSYMVVIECDTEREQIQLAKDLEQKGIQCRLMS